MKDLYSFDSTFDDALATYRQVQAAYLGLFRELRLPVIMAAASSGDMGGNLSHEFLLPCQVGEDFVVSCDQCGYAASSEVAQSNPARDAHGVEHCPDSPSPIAWRGITSDHKTLVTVWYLPPCAVGAETSSRPSSDVSIPAVKALVPDLDASIDDPLGLWIRTHRSGQPTNALILLDGSISDHEPADGFGPLSLKGLDASGLAHEINITVLRETQESMPLRLLRVHDGDLCASCGIGKLRLSKALELGHTFYLGTRYSEPLNARVQLPPTHNQVRPNSDQGGALTAMQMGCYGIGVSRLFGAIAEHFSDERGLLWPRVAAPFGVVIIPGAGLEEEAARVYDEIGPGADAVLDDRSIGFIRKLKDSELIGYPVVVLIAKAWQSSGMCEVHCRMLGRTEMVPFEAVKTVVSEFLAQS